MMSGKVALTELYRNWAEVSRAYDWGVVCAERLLANATPMRFRVAGLGFRAADQQWEPLKTFLFENRWGFINGSDLNSNAEHYAIRTGTLGAMSSAYVAAGEIDIGLLFDIAYVLQMSQKVRVAKGLGKHQDFEYFLYPPCVMHGFVPNLICVGPQFEPLRRMVETMAVNGYIHRDDTKLVNFVPDMESALGLLREQENHWAPLIDPNALKRSAAVDPLDDLVKVLGFWQAFRDAMRDVYFPQLVEFSDCLELRGRVAGLGSHLVSGNGEGEEFGYRVAKRRFDTVTGGGPKLMREMAEGASAAALSDLALISGPKTIGMALWLPDEQTLKMTVDFLFENGHFSKRLDGFGALASFFVAKRRAGFGTLFEMLYAMYLGDRMLDEEGCTAFDMPTHPVSRLGGYVPRVIAIGDLYEPLIEMMGLSNATSESARRLLKVVPNLDAMDRALDEDVRRWDNACLKAALTPVVMQPRTTAQILTA